MRFLLIVLINHLGEVIVKHRRLAVPLHKPIHVVVSRFVCLFKLVVQQLRVVNAEPTMLSSLADNFVDHVKSVFWNFCSLKLVNDHLSHGLVFRVVQRN